jgi:amidohydrolase
MEMLEKAKKLQQQIVEWRRDFHKHPELGFEETRTSGIVAEYMKSLGYRVRTGVGKTGVIAELGDKKPVVGIRADMDALPIQEANDVPYKSQVDGVMHACGHDAHTAIAMGVATLLKESDLPGTVRFFFQPSEEKEDEEGISGAPRMIEDGAMEGVDSVIALHVDANEKTGIIQIADDVSAAGVDTFYGTVIGRGGHGSTPEKVIDPILITGHVILALHSIVSRRLWPFDPAVVSIGSVQGGHIDNVIPESVELTGTLRFLEPHVQKKLHEEVERAFQIAKTMGGDYKLKIVIGYPPMKNNPEIVTLIKKVAGDLISPKNVEAPPPQLGAEDFGFFMQKAPGAMFMLGCGFEDDIRRHHDPRFDVNEECLPIGAAILAETALRYMGQNK